MFQASSLIKSLLQGPNHFKKLCSYSSLSSVNISNYTEGICVSKKGKQPYLLKVSNGFLPTTSSWNLNGINRVHGTPSRLPRLVEEPPTVRSALSNLRDISYAPAAALALGMAGLIPFVVPPTCMVISGVYLAKLAHAQVVYGACILSYLGGVRWGINIPEEHLSYEEWRILGYSVAPCLVACTALLLPWTGLSNCLVMAGLGTAAYLDLGMKINPGWYKGMRVLLTTVAIFSLWCTLMCSLILRDSKDKTVTAHNVTAEQQPPAAKDENE